MTSILAGQHSTVDRTFFWRTKRQGAMRSGKWKYLREGQAEFLFDLSIDEREQWDFKEQSPDVLKRLRGEFGRWESEMMRYPVSPSVLP